MGFIKSFKNWNFNFGWFKGEEFRLFNFVILHFVPDIDFIPLLRFQIGKFIIELSYSKNS